MTDYMALKAENQRLNDEEARAGKARIESRPLSFSLDLCGKCTLKCMHCGCHIHGRSSNAEISDAVYDKVIAAIMPTAFKCHLGGGNYGEVTVASHFHQFLRDCDKHQVRINLTTNATHIMDEWLDDLLRRLIVVGFSLEGLREEYEKIRRFKWTRFLKNVQKVCDRRAQLGLTKSFRTEWRYCAHADCVHQLPEMVRLAKDIGIDRIQIMPLTPYVESQRYKNLSYHRTLANRYFEEARAVAAEVGIDVKVPPNFSTGTFDDIEESAGRRGGTGRPRVTTIPNCYMPWQSCSINELGFVAVCHLIARPFGTIGHPLGATFKSIRLGSIGAGWDDKLATIPMSGGLSLLDRSFDDVWNGWQYQLLRSRVNSRSPKICYACRQPLWDSEENLVLSNLEASLLETVKSTARRALEGGRKVAFDGVVDWNYDLLSER